MSVSDLKHIETFYLAYTAYSLGYFPCTLKAEWYECAWRTAGAPSLMFCIDPRTAKEPLLGSSWPKMLKERGDSMRRKRGQSVGRCGGGEGEMREKWGQCKEIQRGKEEKGHFEEKVKRKRAFRGENVKRKGKVRGDNIRMKRYKEVHKDDEKDEGHYAEWQRQYGRGKCEKKWNILRREHEEKGDNRRRNWWEKGNILRRNYEDKGDKMKEKIWWGNLLLACSCFSQTSHWISCGYESGLNRSCKVFFLLNFNEEIRHKKMWMSATFLFSHILCLKLSSSSQS